MHQPEAFDLLVDHDEHQPTSTDVVNRYTFARWVCDQHIVDIACFARAARRADEPFARHLLDRE